MILLCLEHENSRVWFRQETDQLSPCHLIFEAG
jgi:hypothetical protein